MKFAPAARLAIRINNVSPGTITAPTLERSKNTLISQLLIALK